MGDDLDIIPALGIAFHNPLFPNNKISPIISTSQNSYIFGGGVKWSGSYFYVKDWYMKASLSPQKIK